MEAAEALGPAQVWNLAPHRVPENSGALQWHVSVPPPPAPCTLVRGPWAPDSLPVLRTLPPPFPWLEPKPAFVTSPPPASQRWPSSTAR